MVVSVVPRVQSVVRVVHLHMNCAPTPEQTLNVDGIRQSPFAAAGSDEPEQLYRPSRVRRPLSTPRAVRHTPPLCWCMILWDAGGPAR